MTGETTTGRPVKSAANGQARPGLVLAVACLCQLMVVLDMTVVNVALPSIRADLGFSVSSLQWVVNAYTLTFGGLLLLGPLAAHVRVAEMMPHLGRLRGEDHGVDAALVQQLELPVDDHLADLVVGDLRIGRRPGPGFP
jgi:MFS family permease